MGFDRVPMLSRKNWPRRWWALRALSVALCLSEGRLSNDGPSTALFTWFLLHNDEIHCVCSCLLLACEQHRPAGVIRKAERRWANEATALARIMMPPPKQCFNESCKISSERVEGTSRLLPVYWMTAILSAGTHAFPPFSKNVPTQTEMRHSRCELVYTKLVLISCLRRTIRRLLSALM